jgi:hypothetical protein
MSLAPLITPYLYPAELAEGIRRDYGLRDHRLALPGRASGLALTPRRFPPPWSYRIGRWAGRMNPALSSISDWFAPLGN